MLTWLGMPLAASTHAAEIDHMMVLVHWLMLVMFVGWGVFFVFVLFRFRKGVNPKASYAGAKGKISKGTEVAVAIVEVLLLVFYAIPAWAKRVKAFPSENEAVHAGIEAGSVGTAQGLREPHVVHQGVDRLGQLDPRVP